MKAVHLNSSLNRASGLIFAGDYEVVGPDPALGHETVAGLGVSMILIHYHHRHEFVGGGNKGLWGTLCRAQPETGGVDWCELDRVVASAKEKFPLVGLYPIGWAHMVPRHLGETVQDVDPEVVSDWIADVVDRYWKQVDVFPIFYEINVFDLFFRVTHGQGYGDRERRHILRCLTRSVEKVAARSGPVALSKLTAATFVELTKSSFYWMSEGKLLELPRGSSLLEAPLCPADLLDIAKKEDTREGGHRHTNAIKQLLHHLIFWNADDSGAENTVGDDLERIVHSGLIYDPDHYPEGVVHAVIAGWDAQPQNTYEYLLRVMRPDLLISAPATCLEKNYEEFVRFQEDPSIPRAIRNRIIGFVLDDVFKCMKQSGVTSAVYPTEKIEASGLRTGSGPIQVSEIGKVFASIIQSVASSRRIEA